VGLQGRMAGRCTPLASSRWMDLLSILSDVRPTSPYRHTRTDTFPPGYIGEFEIVDDHRGGKIVIQLNGRLNKTGVISPRFNITLDAIENWVTLLLPARSFGKIILTTSAGIMDHEEARRKHVSSG
jgi:hypothetical protein